MVPQNPCCRCCLTSLHVIACVTGGFYAIWLLLHREVHETCLAKSPSYTIMTLNACVKGDAEALTCDTILYACIVAVAWSLMSVICVTACNFRKCLVTVQILISSVLGLLFLALGCVLAIDFVEWCASISSCSNHVVCPPSDCLMASQYHDSVPNNTVTVDLFWNSAVELVCVWTLSPAVIILAFCYVASLRISRPASPAPEQPVCQGHCCGDAHSCHQANIQGPLDGNDFTALPSYIRYHESPTQYSNAARYHLHPDPHPAVRHAAEDTEAQAASSRHWEDDVTPLLTDRRDGETRSEGYGSTETAAPLPSTAP